MIDSGECGPVNLGNPEEFTVAELAGLVLRISFSLLVTAGDAGAGTAGITAHGGFLVLMLAS